MNPHWEALNAWHLQLSICADALDHVLREVEDPPGLSAMADVLKTRLQDLVESCPFPTGETASAGEREHAGGSQHD